MYQGDYLSESKVPFIVGVGSWLLAASVLVYGYSSIVVSSITLPNQMPTVNSFEDVVSHPDISLIIRTDTFIGSLINTVSHHGLTSSNNFASDSFRLQTTDVPIYNALRDKAKRRPESIGYEGFINSTALLLTGKYAFPFVSN